MIDKSSEDDSELSIPIQFPLDTKQHFILLGGLSVLEIFSLSGVEFIAGITALVACLITIYFLVVYFYNLFSLKSVEAEELSEVITNVSEVFGFSLLLSIISSFFLGFANAALSFNDAIPYITSISLMFGGTATIGFLICVVSGTCIVVRIASERK